MGGGDEGHFSCPRTGPLPRYGALHVDQQQNIAENVAVPHVQPRKDASPRSLMRNAFM